MDAIQLMLIDARKKAAKKIIELYGSSYFNIGSNQYQIMALNADGTAKTDANGYITVKDLSTGKTNTGYDPLTTGVFTTTPLTSATILANNPSLGPNQGGGGGGNMTGTIMGAAGLAMPAIGLFKGKGGGPTGPAPIVGSETFKNASFSPNAGGGGPGGVPAQSPTGGINVYGDWNNLRIPNASPSNNPTTPGLYVRTTTTETTQPNISSPAGGQETIGQENFGQGTNGLPQKTYTLNGTTFTESILPPPGQTPNGFPPLQPGSVIGSVNSGGFNLNVWQSPPNALGQTVQVSLKPGTPISALSSIQTGPVSIEGVSEPGITIDGNSFPVKYGSRIAFGPDATINGGKISGPLDQWSFDPVKPNQPFIDASNLNMPSMGGGLPPELAGLNTNSIPNQDPNTVWQFKSDSGETFYQINDPKQFISGGTVNQSDPLYQYAYDYLKKAGTPITQITDAKINQFIKNEYLDIAKTPIPEDTWNLAKANVDANYNDKLQWRQESPDGMLSPMPEAPTEKDYAIEAQTMLRQQRSDKQEASIIKGEQTKFLGSLAGAGIASWGLFQSIFGMTENGKPTAKGVIGALGSMIGLATAMNFMHTALTKVLLNGTKTLSDFAEKLNRLSTDGLLSHIPILNHLHLGSIFQHMSGTIGTLVTMAALIALAVFMGKKDSETTAMENLNQDVAPTVWSNGPVMMLTAGLSLASMGINLNPNAPMMQQIMVPQIQLNASIAKATGGNIPTDGQRYGTAFVQQGANGQPDMVVYLTPGGVDSRGNTMDVVHTVQLKANMKFANPGSNGYIPFFIKDSGGNTVQNPMAVAAIDCQTEMLHCAGNTSPADAQRCAMVAAACNKNGNTL